MLKNKVSRRQFLKAGGMMGAFMVFSGLFSNLNFGGFGSDSDSTTKASANGRKGVKVVTKTGYGTSQYGIN